jgi:hypothetical protein
MPVDPERRDFELAGDRLTGIAGPGKTKAILLARGKTPKANVQRFGDRAACAARMKLPAGLRSSFMDEAVR